MCFSSGQVIIQSLYCITCGRWAHVSAPRHILSLSSASWIESTWTPTPVLGILADVLPSLSFPLASWHGARVGRELGMSRVASVRVTLCSTGGSFTLASQCDSTAAWIHEHFSPTVDVRSSVY